MGSSVASSSWSPSAAGWPGPCSAGRRAGLASTSRGPGASDGGAILSLASTTVVATGSLAAIGGVLASPSGEARLAVLAATSIGVSIGTRSAKAAGLLAGVAIVAEAASGHAASSALPPIAIASFAVHLSVVGVWIYAIGTSLLAAPSVGRALGTFTPYAVTAAVVTAGTGLLNALLELADPADLVDTGYGLALVAKTLAFVMMASFGLLHFIWRRRPACAAYDCPTPRHHPLPATRWGTENPRPRPGA